MRRLAAWTAAIAVVATSGSARAQTPLAGGFEVSVGAGVLGGAGLDGQSADLRAGGSGDAFRLFGSESSLGRAAVIEARLGFVLTSRIAVEGRVAVDRPEWRTTIAGDFEGAPDITLRERINEYTVDGGVRVSLDPWRVLGLTPFAAAGAGYLRQLHEQAALVEERPIVYAGGGLSRTLVMRPAGVLRSAGIRADLRLNLRGGGGSFGERTRPQGAVSGGVFLVF